MISAITVSSRPLAVDRIGALHLAWTTNLRVAVDSIGRAGCPLTQGLVAMFGRHVARTVRPFVKCHLQELSKMQGTAAGQPGDLLPTTEPVGNDRRGRVGIADGRQQNSLAHRDRHVIVSGLEAERTRHAATAGIENLSRCRICGLKGWQGMANSSTSPILVCVNSTVSGGSYAQVHYHPDTRPSLPLRQRLLPAAPGLPGQ